MTEESAKKWLERARAIAPIVQEYREESDRERRLPQPVFEAVCKAGFLQMLVHARSAGSRSSWKKRSWSQRSSGARTAALAGMSPLAVAGALFGDYLSEAAARDIFGRHDAVVAGQLCAEGRASRVEGGYRLSGQWSFVSGCQNANWILSGGIVFEGENRSLAPMGLQSPNCSCFLPRQGQIIDTWRTGGMRGTGATTTPSSTSLCPTRGPFPLQAFFERPAPRPNLGSRAPSWSGSAAFSQPWDSGLLATPSNRLTALAGTKTAFGREHETGRAKPPFMSGLAALRRCCASARSYLFETAREITSASESTPPMVLPVAVSCGARARSAAEIVNAMYEAGGGTAIYETSRLERCFRDVNTLTHHFLIARSLRRCRGTTPEYPLITKPRRRRLRPPHGRSRHCSLIPRYRQQSRRRRSSKKESRPGS